MKRQYDTVIILDSPARCGAALGGDWLRFSNFGNMVSIDPSLEVGDATLDIVHIFCKEKGYVFVPSDFTELPYTGMNPGVTGIRDWWIRYFDWV